MDLDRIKQLVAYDPETGRFWWKVNCGRGRAGTVLGSEHSGGYRECKIDGERFFLHRLAWLYFYGEMPKEQIDHINGDRTDNRISNLRKATQQQNSGNMKIRPNNKVGFKGVYKVNRTKPFQANIHINGKTKYLGLFDTAEEAHRAYLEAAKDAFGDYARSK